jgi:hypothetical protein
LFYFFAVPEYAVPFKEFVGRNDEYRLVGTLKRKGNLSSAFEKADSSVFM